jgi:hypothetical protein
VKAISSAKTTVFAGLGEVVVPPTWTVVQALQMMVPQRMLLQEMTHHQMLMLMLMLMRTRMPMRMLMATRTLMMMALQRMTRTPDSLKKILVVHSRSSQAVTTRAPIPQE